MGNWVVEWGEGCCPSAGARNGHKVQTRQQLSPRTANKDGRGQNRAIQSRAGDQEERENQSLHIPTQTCISQTITWIRTQISASVCSLKMCRCKFSAKKTDRRGTLSTLREEARANERRQALVLLLYEQYYIFIYTPGPRSLEEEPWGA